MRGLKIIFKIFLVFWPVAMFGQAADVAEFEQLCFSKKWSLGFSDKCTGNWQEKWFQDGLIGQVTNSAAGMELKA